MDTLVVIHEIGTFSYWVVWVMFLGLFLLGAVGCQLTIKKRAE